MWSRMAWSHWWSGWAVRLLTDLVVDDGGEDGWGGIGTATRMVRGEGGGGCSSTASSLSRRSAISARRAAISAEHEACF